MRILYLDLDTLRPDHLGCYGYHRNTSPNLDRVAAEGVTFTNCYCSDAPCLPSRTALMSGQFGIHTGVVGHGGTAADFRHDGPTRQFKDAPARQAMPAVLHYQAGLRTVLISPFGERHGAWQFYAGFDEMYNTGRGGGESAEHVTPTVLDWIERNADQDDWYLHVNYWDPHGPYRAPAEFGNPFENEPLPDFLNQEMIERHKKLAGPHKPYEIMMYHNRPNATCPRYPAEIMDMADMKRMYDGYDCGIAYMDSHIGRVFAALEAKGAMDDLAIIVSADHGENMCELGIYGEHGTADNGTCRIPMIVRWPGVEGGRKDDGLHYNLDLPPTLADLLGQDRAPTWDGASYARTLTEGEDCGREYLVVSQCAHVCQRGVRWGPWLYMRTYHDGYHLFPDEMLFNLEDDPFEQNDIAAERPDECKQGAYYLLDWHGKMMATSSSDADPLWTVMREGGPHHARGRLLEYIEHLNNTGRTHLAEELKKKHPNELLPGWKERWMPGG